MPLNFLNDVLRLNLAFKTTKSILQRLTFLKPYLSHSIYTPHICKICTQFYNCKKVVDFAFLVKGNYVVGIIIID